MTEIHESLLAYDDLVEEAATNQGAWLTESAGALRDLHASVLKSLLGYENASNLKRNPRRAASNGKRSSKISGFPESPSSDSTTRKHGGDAPIDDDRHQFDGWEEAVRREGNYVATVKPGDFSEARRTRLFELGRLFACKRQFAASRQVVCLRHPSPRGLGQALVALRGKSNLVARPCVYFVRAHAFLSLFFGLHY